MPWQHGHLKSRRRTVTVGRARSRAASISFHAALVVGALAFLPVVYAILAGALTARAAALPTIQRRRVGTPRPLRPVQVGVVEMVAAVGVVLVAFVMPPG